MKYSVIIVASGKGNRMNLGYNKVYYKIDEEMIIEKSINTFIKDKECTQIIVVTNKEEFHYLNKYNNITLIQGGNRRMDSVLNGLNIVNNEYVLVHDGARPYITLDIINDLKKELLVTDACIVAVDSIDTIKQVKDNGLVTLDRSTIKNAQTPQGFKTSIIKDAYNNINSDIEYTDDASIVEKVLGIRVSYVNGSYSNIKITTLKDIIK